MTTAPPGGHRPIRFEEYLVLAPAPAAEEQPACQARGAYGGPAHDPSGSESYAARRTYRADGNPPGEPGAFANRGYATGAHDSDRADGTKRTKAMATARTNHDADANVRTVGSARQRLRRKSGRLSHAKGQEQE